MMRYSKKKLNLEKRHHELGRVIHFCSHLIGQNYFTDTSEFCKIYPMAVQLFLAK